jgi:hypothetical protein
MCVIITLVYILVEYYDVRHGMIQLACDGIQALHYVFDTDKSVTAANNSHDINLAMRKMIADSRITRKRRHAKGHQDIPWEKLDIWDGANGDCDTDAKTFWAKCRHQQQTPKSISIDNGYCAIWSEDQMVATNTRKVLYHKIHSPKTQSWWMDRGWRPGETFDLVDWTTIKKTDNAAPTTRRIWVMKHNHSMCGTGQIMKLCKYRHTARCPRCGHHKET